MSAPGDKPSLQGSNRSSNLEMARKRNAALHGPPLSFKKSKRKHPINDDVSQRGGLRVGMTKEKSSILEEDDLEGSNPYGRCPNVSNRYEKLDRIGEGTYGIVYRARDKDTNEIVALKRCLPHHESSDGFPLTTLREITTLRELSVHKHPGIVQLREVAVSSSRSGVFLVFEYCEHDLANLVDSHYGTHGRSPFRESEVKRLVIQLLSALQFLHSRHILHRDIKLSNLLYNHRGELRLADFGLSRKVAQTRLGTRFVDDVEDDPWTDSPRRQSNLTPKVVSLWYRPPELLFGSDLYDEGVDNWGTGCVIGELLLGVPLIQGKNEMDQITKMFELLGPPNSIQWPGLYDMPLVKSGSIEIPRRMHVLPSSSSSGRSLLDRFCYLSPSGLALMSNLLKYDFTVRWTAEEALASDYFSELPTPTNRGLMPTFPTKHGGR